MLLGHSIHPTLLTGGPDSEFLRYTGPVLPRVGGTSSPRALSPASTASLCRSVTVCRRYSSGETGLQDPGWNPEFSRVPPGRGGDLRPHSVSGCPRLSPPAPLPRRRKSPGPGWGTMFLFPKVYPWGSGTSTRPRSVGPRRPNIVDLFFLPFPSSYPPRLHPGHSSPTTSRSPASPLTAHPLSLSLSPSTQCPKEDLLPHPDSGFLPPKS